VKRLLFKDDLKQRQHNRDVELIRIQQQVELAKIEVNTRTSEVSARSSSQSSFVNESRSSKSFNFNLGLFSNKPEKLDAFLVRFETVATAYELPEPLHAIELAKCLSAESLQVAWTMNKSSLR
jgi:hypothetical protein